VTVNANSGNPRIIRHGGIWKVVNEEVLEEVRKRLPKLAKEEHLREN
jgi:hypothetical protein